MEAKVEPACWPNRGPDGGDATMMSLRDYFAAQTLTVAKHYNDQTSAEALARHCYEIADAMLAERAK